MKPNPLIILNRASAEPPADGWFQIEVSGEHPANGNRIQVIDSKALESIVNRFAQDRSAAGDNWAGMLVDPDHLSQDQDHSTEALAWLQELDIRNGQLFGRMDLTDLGTAAVRNKRYKFLSTEYDGNDLEDLGNGRVRPLRLAGLAFTNRPNNRGGKPISNRAGNQGGEPQTTDETPPMKSIAAKLGLAPEATEAEILTAIGTLQQQCADLENKCATDEADKVMNRFGTRIPEAARPHWKAELIRNRADTEKLMETSFPEGTNIRQIEKPIFNRSGASAPTPVEAAEQKAAKDGEAKAAAIQNRAHSIAKERNIPYSQAFGLAQAEAG